MTKVAWTLGFPLALLALILTGATEQVVAGEACGGTCLTNVECKSSEPGVKCFCEGAKPPTKGTCSKSDD